MPATSNPSIQRRALQFVIILLIVDALLIGGDVLRHNGVLHDHRFAITTERGFAEWFQYGKSLTIVLLLLSIAQENAAAPIWAALFAYLLVDDAFEVHESVGTALASALSLPQIGSVRPGQLAELLVFGGVGFVFVVTLGFVLLRRNGGARSLSIVLAVPFALLAFFGAVMDLLHSLLRGHGYYYVAGLMEDGGELLTMSILVAVAYWVTRRERKTSSGNTN